MLKSKSETFFLLLSILLLVLGGGIYMISAKTRQNTTTVTNTTQTLSSEDQKQRDIAEKAVKALENNPSDEALQKAKDLTDKLPSSAFKSGLQKRISTAEVTLKQVQTAEIAVQTAETSLTATDIEAAQKEVDKLKDSETKTNLQKRIDALGQSANTTAVQSNEAASTATDTNGYATETVETPQTTYSNTPVTPTTPADSATSETTVTDQGQAGTNQAQ